jgi:hypothetical protein
MDWSDPVSLEPVWEIPTADGKGFTNRISIDRAKELNLLPRVTGIIADVLGDSWAIGQYRQRQAILAAEGTTRADGEHDDDYVERVAAEAGKAAKASRDRGRVVHEGVREFLVTGRLPSDGAVVAVSKDIAAFLARIDARGVSCEKALGGLRKGYVGTPDIHAADADLAAVDALVDSREGFRARSGRGEVVIDLKCTDLAKFKKPYREHLYQFGGYGNLLDLSESARYVQWYADPWTGEFKLLRHDDTKLWMQAFDHLYRTWLIETGFNRNN